MDYKEAKQVLKGIKGLSPSSTEAWNVWAKVTYKSMAKQQRTAAIKAVESEADCSQGEGEK